MKHQITESQYFCSCPTFSSWRYSVDFILYIQTLPQIFQHHNKFACQTTKEPTEKKNRHNRKDRKEIHLNFSRNASKNVKKPRGQSFFLSLSLSLAIPHFVYRKQPSHTTWCWECFGFLCLLENRYVYNFEGVQYFC